VGPKVSSPTSSTKWAWLDRLGITASVACGIHCLISALFFLILPGIFEWAEGSHTLEFISSNLIHWGFAFLVFPLALVSLTQGYRLHKKKRSLILGLTGLFLVGMGLMTHESILEPVLTISGGAILSWAHFINLRTAHHCHS
tara:strand:- start:2 stop:427 length:426 start_codon:yes stop_codon:yes gene_type:complete